MPGNDCFPGFILYLCLKIQTPGKYPYKEISDDK